jgi:hypothetical protein
MINLLGGWRLSGTRPPESEGPQQPIEVGQGGKVNRRRAKHHRRADAGIKHPAGDNDRNAWFARNDRNLSVGAPFGVKLPNFAAMQRMPAVMDLHILVDMGRMDPR